MGGVQGGQRTGKRGGERGLEGLNVGAMSSIAKGSGVGENITGDGREGEVSEANTTHGSG